MTAAPLPRAAETPVLLGLGIACIFAALIPLAPGGRLVAPDLIWCLVIAWVIRRPATPFWAILLIGLAGDVLLSRPLGLGALGLLLGAELFRSRARSLRSAGFLLEWLAATAGFAALLVQTHLVLVLVFADPPGIAASLGYLLVTAISYPIVVLGLTWCLRLRAPAAQRAASFARST